MSWVYCAWNFTNNIPAPIATMSASFIAISITFYFACHQKRISYQQKQISSENLKLDLFNKRYKTFEAVHSCCNALLFWKGTDEQKEAKSKFFMARQQVRFLFGEDVENIFTEILGAGEEV